MEVHHELACLFVKDHLGAFQNAAFGDVALRVFGDGERDSFVFPVIEVFGGVNGNADHR